VSEAFTVVRVATQEERTARATSAVLTAADALFGRDGFRATSVQRIAETAGVSKSGLLHHFGSKDEIFRQVFIRAQEELVERSTQGMENLAPKEQLEHGALRLLDALNDPRLRQIALVDAPAVLGWAEWRRIEAEHAISIIVAVLETAAATGTLTVAPTASVAGMLLAALHEASFALIDHPAARPEVEDTLRRIIGALFAPATPTPRRQRR
jgi:AcrR family transcriptional regulator